MSLLSRAVLLLALFLAWPHNARGADSGSPSQDGLPPGPCSVTSLSLPSIAINATDSACATYQTCHVDADLLLPSSCPPHSDSQQTQQRSSLPLIVFFPGFGVRSSYYAAHLQLLASWGFIVVSYSYEPPLLTSLSSLPDTAELPLLPYVLSRVGLAIGGTADLSRIGFLGHSRGGKIAALHSALAKSRWQCGGRQGLGSSPVGGLGCGSAPLSEVATFLLDPVDQIPFFNPVSLYQSYLSGSSYAQAAKLKMAIVGAGGIAGSCNPVTSNYLQYTTNARGQLLAVLPGAAHMSFADAGPTLNTAGDQICMSYGSMSRASVASAIAPLLVFWFNKELDGPYAEMFPQQDFLDTVSDTQKKGLLMLRFTKDPDAPSLSGQPGSGDGRNGTSLTDGSPPSSSGSGAVSAFDGPGDDSTSRDSAWLDGLVRSQAQVQAQPQLPALMQSTLQVMQWSA